MTKPGDFDIPFALRSSPELDRVRDHHTAWLRSHNVLVNDVAVKKYLAFRIPESVVTCWPDAQGSNMDLACDFVGWTRIVDDMFGDLGPEVVRECDAAYGAIMATLGLEGTGDTPASAHPIARSFADVWARLADGMSLAWQKRFADATRRFLNACRNEAHARQHGLQVASWDYWLSRRDAIYTDGYFALTERVCRQEVPGRLFATSQLKTLQDTGALMISLVNDMYSYEIEALQGDSNNLVLITEREEGCTRQEAATRVLRKIKDMAQHFVTVEAELPSLYEVWQLIDFERESVDLYVDCIRNVTATTRDWSYTSSHYDVPAEERNHSGL